MKYGYARVSTKQQNLDRQILELKKYVDEDKIVVDKESGKDTDRPGYQALKGALGLRRGDILYIDELDRLSRCKSDIKKELEWFKEHGIRVIILDLPTTMVSIGAGQEWILDMLNEILIEVLASIAEHERLTIRKRQREGIDAAKVKGKHLGRPRKVLKEGWEFVVADWKQGKFTATEAARQLGISRSQFYRIAPKKV